MAKISLSLSRRAVRAPRHEVGEQIRIRRRPVARRLQLVDPRLLLRRNLPRQLAEPAAMPILAHHDAGAITGAHQPHQIVGAHLIRLEPCQPDTIETDIRATLADPPVIRRIGVAAAMADQATMQLLATAAECRLLFRTAHAILGVRDDRHAGRALRDAGGFEELRLQRRNRGGAGGDLDRTRAHAGATNAVGSLWRPTWYARTASRYPSATATAG